MRELIAIDPEIRLARESDLGAIAAIYNYEVEHSTATFDTEPVSIENRREWLKKHGALRRPVVVAEVEGEVIGWASLSDWSERCAYARAAEVSVYIHRSHRKKGVGKMLLVDLIDRARRGGIGVLLARICTLNGEASIHLHQSVGFQRVGTMRRVGQKFGQILDIELLDLQLD